MGVGREGGNVVVNYTGWLQSADRVEGPYTNVLGATSPYRWPASTESQRFGSSVRGGGSQERNKTKGRGEHGAIMV